MVKGNTFLKAFLSCCLIWLQVNTGLCESLRRSVVQISARNVFLCAGTLVTPNHVVTSAYCTEARITLGAYAVTYGKAENCKTSVSKIIVHPNFDSEKSEYNVAVLTLTSAVPKKVNSVARLCTQTLHPGNLITAYAWSVPKTGPTATKLESFELFVQPQSVCQQSIPYRYETSLTYCGINNRVPACFSANGGPVEVKGEFCGIVAFALTYENNPNQTTGFINITHPAILDFIKCQMDK